MTKNTKKTSRDKRPEPEKFSRGEGVAIWRQISEDIASKIASGEWPEGQRLSTETELSQSYGVNRHTLRRALQDLSRRGLVEAAPRRGTFVSNARIEYPIRQQTQFSEIIRQAGREPGGKLLSCRTTTAPPEMAQRLKIAEKARVIEVEFLRMANEIPICWSFSWFPADRFGRLPQFLERGMTITGRASPSGAQEVLASRNADQRQSRKRQGTIHAGTGSRRCRAGH